MPRLYRRKTIWWVDYFDGPRRIRRSLRTRDKQIAQHQIGALLLRRRPRADGTIDRLTLAEAIARYQAAASAWKSPDAPMHESC